MALYELDSLRPQVDPSAWVAESAQVLGKVRLAQDASVWFQVVIRGDTETIDIGEGSNARQSCLPSPC